MEAVWHFRSEKDKQARRAVGTQPTSTEPAAPCQRAHPTATEVFLGGTLLWDMKQEELPQVVLDVAERALDRMLTRRVVSTDSKIINLFLQCLSRA